MSGLVERLAVEAVRQMGGMGTRAWTIDDALVPIAYSSYYQAVADAIRAAVDEAAATVEGCDRDAKRHEIADKIRALK